MAAEEIEGWCIYDYGLMKRGAFILKWPLAVLFLVDFYLRWGLGY